MWDHSKFSGGECKDMNSLRNVSNVRLWSQTKPEERNEHLLIVQTLFNDQVLCMDSNRGFVMVGISKTIIWHVISLYRCHVHVSHWFSATNDVVYKVLHMKGGSVELMF